MTTSEATRPWLSTSTAIGDPLAPNRGPTVRLGSSSTGERRPCAWFISTVPVEMTSN